MVTDFKYPGDELHLFQHAKNWKTYFSKQIKPYLKGNILEVGAGIGATTPLLNDGTAKLWMLLEPDMEMSELLRKKIQSNELPVNCKLQTGTINSIGTEHKFDAIIYIDVLEHIEYDKEELQAASSFLQPNGKIIILSPAYQYLYSPFDKAIGHYMRYTRKMLTKITPSGTQVASSNYYDSLGYFATMLNKILLRQKYPSLKQVMFWDKMLVPISRIIDKLFFHSFGKSIIVVWKKIS